MENHFYYDDYNGLSEWVCENVSVPTEFVPVFKVLNFIVVLFTLSVLNDWWAGFSIFMLYLFNPYLIDRLRKERFDDTDMRVALAPIISKQTQTHHSEDGVYYTYEFFFEHPADKQIIPIKVNQSVYDTLSIGEALEVDYCPRYTRQCYVFTPIKNH